MRKKFDAVLFDFDGTIADTGVGVFNSIRLATASMGFKPLNEKTLRTFIGPPLSDSFKRELGLSDEQCKTAVERYRETYGKRGIFQLELYDGIEDLLRELKQNGIKVGVASSKPKKFINRILDFLNFGGLVDFVSAPSLEDEASSDKASLIRNAAEAFGADKSRAVMVGDRHFDVNGARLAGVTSIGVTYGYGSEEELRNAGADYIANSVADIRTIVLY